MNAPKKLWFKRKTYGWGWTPCSWEGWVVVLVYVAVVTGCALTLKEDSEAADVFLRVVFPIIVFTTMLVSISYKKGESPRWQWGDKKEGNKKD